MNKLTLLLQDKEVIAEIAKDPEVQIKIKDAIVDGVVRRFSKSSSIILDESTRALREELFGRNFYENTLNDKYKEVIKRTATDVVADLVRKESKILNNIIENKFEFYKMLIIGKLEAVNVDQMIRDEIRKAVNEKFK